MAQYGRFAEVYDSLMDDVPYDNWVENIIQIFSEYDFKPKDILELACGTGNMTNRFAKKGYKIVGTDISEDMLMIAQDKAHGNNLKVNYLYQDMTNINYPRKVDCVLSFCDGLNYITSDEDMAKVLKGVYNLLLDEGFFIFDISSYYKLSEILGNNRFMESRADVLYFWENYFDKANGLLDMELNIFMKCDDFEDDEELYERVHEEHKQRAHKMEELKALIEENGFDVLRVCDADGLSELNEKTEREYYICRKRR